MKLAAACGLNVAPVSMVKAGGKDVLLIERFDRTRAGEDWHRKAMVSALTILGLDEMMARYASYEDLAEIIRHRFAKPKETLRELFGRICFNVLCGNTDDHARNHAAFWDGEMLTLSPAYDICPQGRTGNEATQAMLIKGDNRMSTWPIALLPPLISCSRTTKQSTSSRNRLSRSPVNGMRSVILRTSAQQTKPYLAGGNS